MANVIYGWYFSETGTIISGLLVSDKTPYLHVVSALQGTAQQAELNQV